tara:strand:+ start:1500 stop:2750 length:1251 start_codon:yes stop_codon:yes gene_type:complete
MLNKSIGILVYYWPPSGGSGVQRWLRFSNKLCQMGWDVHIFTFDNPQYPIIDNSLLKLINPKIKISKIKGFEVPLFFKKKSNEESYLLNDNNLINYFKSLVRELFFFPDTRRFLIKPSTKHVIKYIKKNKLKYLITSGPPHSMHYIGYYIKRKIQIKWITDFRDPWTNFFQNRMINRFKFTFKRHFQSESKILNNCDSVFMASKSLNILRKKSKKYLFIPSGFDEFIESNDHNKFRILYSGSMKFIQNPEKLWIVLEEILNSHIDFKKSLEVLLIGNIDKKILMSKKFLKIKKYCSFNTYLSKEKLDYEISISQLLLVSSVNMPKVNDVITGKFFHYLSSRKKILGFANKGSDLENLIRKTNSGKCFDYETTQELKEYIQNCFNNFCDNISNDRQFCKKYLSSRITKDIENHLLSI